MPDVLRVHPYVPWWPQYCLINFQYHLVHKVWWQIWSFFGKHLERNDFLRVALRHHQENMRVLPRLLNGQSYQNRHLADQCPRVQPKYGNHQTCQVCSWIREENPCLDFRERDCRGHHRLLLVFQIRQVPREYFQIRLHRMEELGADCWVISKTRESRLRRSQIGEPTGDLDSLVQVWADRNPCVSRIFYMQLLFSLLHLQKVQEQAAKIRGQP